MSPTADIPRMRDSLFSHVADTKWETVAGVSNGQNRIEVYAMHRYKCTRLDSEITNTMTYLPSPFRDAHRSRWALGCGWGRALPSDTPQA